MRKVIALALMMTAVFGTCAFGAQQLRVGMECAFAPHNWQEGAATDSNWPVENVPGGYADGYDVQMSKILSEKLGYELVIIKMAWDGLIEALNNGQIDAIIAGMTGTPERREAINFTDPYYITEYGIMVKAGSKYENAQSISDFEGASILGQKGTIFDTVIDQMKGVNHLTPVDSVPNMLSRLSQDTCDGLVVAIENTPAYIAVNPEFRVIRFAEGKGFDVDTELNIGIRKSDANLLKAMNAALAEISTETRVSLWNTAVENQPK